MTLLLAFNLIESKLRAVEPLPEGLIQTNGRIEGDHVIVSSKFPGRLVELNAREGDTVVKGDPLMKVSDLQTEAKREQAAANLASSVAQAEGSSGSVDLTRETGSAVILQAQGQVAEADSAIGSADANLLQTDAAMDSAKAAKAVAEVNIGLAKSALISMRASRERAVAAYTGAKAAFASAKASLAAAQSDVESARALAEQAERDAKRYSNLEAQGAVSAQLAERARTDAARSKAALATAAHQAEAMQASLEAKTADVESAKQAVEMGNAGIQQAQAQVEAANQQARAAAASVKQAGAQRSAAQHRVEESRARKSQALGLLNQALTASTQVRVSQKNSLSAQARIKQARAALSEIESVLQEMTVKSPISGTVVTRFQDRGELVTAGSPILELVDLDRLYLKVYVPEQMIGKMRLGLPARIYVDAFPNEPFSAKVGYIAAEAEFTPKEIQTAAERVSLVYAVHLYLDSNPGHRLTPGLPADAMIRWKEEVPWQKPR